MHSSQAGSEWNAQDLRSKVRLRQPRSRYFVFICLFLLGLLSSVTASASINRDVTISQDGSSASPSITSPAFTTAASNEQLLAFISTDYLTGSNTTVKSVAGGGLTWTLVARANGQSGSSEIWAAYAAVPVSSLSVTATVSQKVVSSITVMSFSGVRSGGAIGAVATKSSASGAPTASLVTTGPNSLVLGVGNDYDAAVARTVATGQTVVHQDLTSKGDTYWVQMLASPVVATSTLVTLSDTAPTKDRFNLASVELLAASSGDPTYTITGTITPSTAGSGASIALSGPSSASTIADDSGAYSFAGLANGSYTLTPSRPGYAFAPASQSVTLSGANATAGTFSAHAVASWSLSGTVGANGCPGCAYVQSTHSSQSGHVDTPTLLNVKAGDALVYIGEFTNWTAGATVNMTDSHGNTWYRCDNNTTSDFPEIQDGAANGMSCHYAINTAAWSTLTAQPKASQCVNINCTQVGGSFFELALPANATAIAWGTPYSGVSTSGSDNVNCGQIGLTQPNAFVLCNFNNASGTPSAGSAPVPFKLNESTVTAIETGLYPGTGVITPTGTLGTSGIAYTAFTVAFGGTSGGAASSVALSGTSTATATADARGNYLFPGLTNGTYTVTPTLAGSVFLPLSQTLTLNGANISGINFSPQAAVTFSISGTLSPSSGGAGATLALSGSSTASTTADANGNYNFRGLSNGSYTVTPTNSGYTFTPSKQSATLNGADQSGVNFTAQAAVSWSLSGTISPIAGGANAKVTLSGAASITTTADANGNYTFNGLANGSYTVTPSKTNYAFLPAAQPVTISGANLAAVDFSAQSTVSTYSISGSISPSSTGAGTSVSLSGAATATTLADANGNYSFNQLVPGTYAVTPAKSGFSFAPTTQSVTLSGSTVNNINFAASTATYPSLARDVTVSQDGSSASTTITSPVFSTTQGNEELLAFVAADDLGGTNTTVKAVAGAGLTWTLVARANVQSGTAEIWGAYAPGVVTGAAVTATVSQNVLTSMTVMSFSGVRSGGAIGAVATANASSGAPYASLVTTGLNSLVVGIGNDFDNALARTPTAGQILIHQDLTSTGDTYWVQMLSSPVATSATKVTLSDTAPTKDRFNVAIAELLAAGSGAAPTPPSVSMTSPAPSSTVAGLLTVSANASDAAAVVGVQFLLDGSPVGAELTSLPYSFVLDTTPLNLGPHTLSARARDGSGLSSTSAAVPFTVGSTGDASVVGQWSSVFPLPAVAVDLVLLQNSQVLLYQDGSTPTVWNYSTDTFTSAPFPANLFCSGHALLADGRVLVAGGYGNSGSTIGIANAEIFDPVSKAWTAVPNMQYRRWYPTATTLSDGRILVTAGWQTSAHTNAGISEIYNPATNNWTSLTNANNPFETYPFLYLLPDGRVIHIGGSEYPTDTDVLDLNAVTWSVIDPTIVDGASATMYLPNIFMKAGSASDSQDVGPSSNTTFVLDMTQPTPAWKQTPSMVYPRSFMNLTMLPDGSTLATGGETDRNGGDISKAVYAAELWAPQTQTWSTMASMHTPREYHGTALLLPDARVLVSGMGADFGNVPDEKSAEFYSPPYLFKGPRPTITQAPSQVQYNLNFFVQTPDGASITSVSLIRTGAVTHFFDQNERFLPLKFSQTVGGLTVTAPVDANLAPPGLYMLFLVNSAGVPSIAPFVQLP